MRSSICAQWIRWLENGSLRRARSGRVVRSGRSGARELTLNLLRGRWLMVFEVPGRRSGLFGGRICRRLLLLVRQGSGAKDKKGPATRLLLIRQNMRHLHYRKPFDLNAIRTTNETVNQDHSRHGILSCRLATAFIPIPSLRRIRYQRF